MDGVLVTYLLLLKDTTIKATYKKRRFEGLTASEGESIGILVGSTAASVWALKQ